MNINIEIPIFSDLCPYCFGSGKQKAMQMAMTYNKGSVRVNDTKVKCQQCNGTGRNQTQ